MSVEFPPNRCLVRTRAEWRAWLVEHHERAEGVWVVTYKKASGGPRDDYAEIVEEALCFGWIDSKPRALDEERSMLWCAPRKPGSGWSKLNKQRVHRLIASGLMTEAGRAKIAAAEKDGSWTALDEVETLQIPPDLAQELAKYPRAAANFDGFPRFTKRSILEWISAAKKPETRAKRVEETARLANDNVRANQWRK